VTIEVQCTSCHTRYRIDEQVLPEGTPTFKCSRCGHVFTIDPRGAARADDPAEPAAPTSAARTPRVRRPVRDAAAEPMVGEKAAPDAHAGWVSGAGTTESPPAKDQAPTFKPAENEAAAATANPEQFKAKPSTDDLLSKPFRDERSPSGENLRFDFNDRLEHEAMVPDEIVHDRDSGEWQVGESDLGTPGEATMAERAQAFSTSDARTEEPAPESKARRKAARPEKSSKPDDEVEFVDEDAAPIYNRSVATHSARFFVALMTLVAIGYGVMTMLIRSAPATAAEMLSHLPKIGDRFVLPIAPARLVAMRDVHADYLRTKGGHVALVVTGIAENVGGAPLHAIQIAASLRDAAQRPLADRAVYCGNNLSAAMVRQMTPHEVEFFQKLDPPKAFTLDPSATAPFVIVFIDPPTGVTRFDVSVASAIKNAPLTETTSG
jgi:predicted Zn finger-like uncharacterized protein